MVFGPLCLAETTETVPCADASRFSCWCRPRINRFLSAYFFIVEHRRSVVMAEAYALNLIHAKL